MSIADIDASQPEPQLTPLRFEAGVERARIVNHAPFGHVGALLRRRSSLQTLKPTLDSVLQTFPANNPILNGANTTDMTTPNIQSVPNTPISNTDIVNQPNTNLLETIPK